MSNDTISINKQMNPNSIKSRKHYTYFALGKCVHNLIELAKFKRKYPKKRISIWRIASTKAPKPTRKRSEQHKV